MSIPNKNMKLISINFNKFLFISFFFFTFHITLFTNAYASSVRGVGTTSVNFLKLGVGARAVSMGEAFASVADDVYAVYWNPAGLVQLERKEVSFTHMEYLESIRYEWLAAAYPISASKTTTDIGSMKILLVDNFDDGTDPNLWDSSMGTWSDIDTGGYSSAMLTYYNQDVQNIYGGEGNSCEMKYLIEQLPDGKPGFAGCWIGLGGRSVSEFQYLVFMVKGAAGGEGFEIGIKDTSYNEVKLDIKKYIRITNAWQIVIIPLSDFEGINTASMDNMSFSFTRQGQGTIYIDNIGFAGKRSGRHTAAISCGWLTTGSMDRYVEIAAPPYYEKRDTFDAGDTIVVFTYAREIALKNYKMPLGINLKFFKETLDDQSSSGFAFDVGSQFVCTMKRRDMILGLVFQNIGYASKMMDKSDLLPFNMKMSFALRSKDRKATVTADINMPVDNVTRFHCGGEYVLANMLSLRAGYILGQDLDIMAGIRAGVGFATKGFSIDYAFSPYDELGNAHRISLSMFFGSPSHSKKLPEEEVSADDIPPRVKLKFTPSVISPNNDGIDDTMEFILSASDDVKVKRWLLKVKKIDGPVVKKFEGRNSPPASVTWDGKDDYYGMIVFNGDYTCQFTAWDEAGNKGESGIKKFKVKIPVKVKNAVIKEEERGLVINLKSSVLFGTGKHKLKSSAYRVIDDVIEVLNAYLENKVSVEGHSDNVGSKNYNQKLSKKRAKNVYNYLVKKGVNAERLTSTGYGEDKPIASNAKASGREKNRRVEIIILKKNTQDTGQE